ncbi:acetyltransferase [Bacillus sp. CMF12]|uniref:acetyltransferase n=1 Tax=Bacillus sp. CMF12 TaxID=2884834 RepID=UPI00207A925C|nr:acetyltransferase [Bacillus sp. CMF12]USK49612.1 acetyltransferase [Bacillus sp. CMF12]
MKPIVIVGCGGHSKVILEIITASKKFKIAAILDDKYEKVTKENNIIKAPISHSEELIRTSIPFFVIAIGNNVVRQQIAERLLKAGAQFPILSHPTAYISPSAQVGEGTVVMANSVINAESMIGRHVIINTASVVEHDNIIEDYVHVSPSVTLTGNIYVGEGTHIGAGATAIPGIQIGKWSIIGAGSTIIINIPSYVTAVGTPAKVIKNRQFK